MAKHENKVYRPSEGKALAGKGVRLAVYKVRSKTTEIEGKPPVIEYYTEGIENIDVVLTNYVMMQIEDEFETHQGWLSELSTRPYRTVVKTLAIVREITDKEAAAMVIGTSIEEYQYALVVAWTIAYGAGDDQVGKLSSRGAIVAASKDRLVNLVVDLWAVGVDEFLGENGSTSGSPSDETTTTSGDEPLTSSDTSLTVIDGEQPKLPSPLPKKARSKTQ